MRVQKKLGILLYIISDFLAASFAWLGLFVFRKFSIEGDTFKWDIFLSDPNFFLGITLIPLGWISFYFILGSYTDIHRKSRLGEFNKTFFATLSGVVIIFFALLLDDIVSSYTNYYQTFSLLFILQFLFTISGRLILLNGAKHRLRKGIVSYRTLIIGGNRNATELYKEIQGMDTALGYEFVGFIEVDKTKTNGLKNHIPKLGGLKDIAKMVEKCAVDEVVIAIETSEHHLINQIINILADQKVIIKIIPDMYDILSGSVKMNHVTGAVLIEIYPDLMPKWQKIIKRLIDVVVSVLIFLTISPFLIYIAIRVKLSSEGPVFYKQTRIGLNGKPFKIIKFRSMEVNAERLGPALSSDKDKRVTSWGRVMRKWRLDELPQFWNVLKGDMALVGPRPERPYFIKRITDVAPHYKHLSKVRPGITSWGMVKFGYAENIEEMVQRLKYDILYIENMSLALDFKILIYTFLTIIQGKGK